MLNIVLLRNIIIFIICITIIILAKNYTDYANLLPTFCAILIMIFTILDFYQNRNKYRSKIKTDKNFNNFRPYIITIITILYALSILIIGFFISTILYLIASSYYLGVKNFKNILITLIFLIPLMYGFFVIFIKTNLPKGILF